MPVRSGPAVAARSIQLRRPVVEAELSAPMAALFSPGALPDMNVVGRFHRRVERERKNGKYGYAHGLGNRSVNFGEHR